MTAVFGALGRRDAPQYARQHLGGERPMLESERHATEAIVAHDALPRHLWLVTLLAGTMLWAAVAVAMRLSRPSWNFVTAVPV
jgi:hypothetical protein